MKRVLLVILISIMLFSFGCSSKVEYTSESIEVLETMEFGEYSDNVNDFCYQWYEEVIVGFGEDEISKSVKSLGLVAEFRVVFNMACLGYNYYSLQVYEDGTGYFKYMMHQYEDFSNGEMMVDRTVGLDEEETKQLLSAIKENDFWTIPSNHPDERLGVDGTTIFIEGYYNKKSHLIKMWEPGPKHSISKIHKAFAEFSETIEENPLNEWW